MRYAVYLAPPSDSPLARFGARVLGRDAESGETIAGYAPPGFAPGDWRALSCEPRRYGFHATLKAPFRLRDDASPADLQAALAAQATPWAPFSLGPLDVSIVRFAEGPGFVALTPRAPSAALAALEAALVHGLDALRAPLTAAEIARRRPERLSPRQRDYLGRFGYPFVLDEFRLHFTLSNALAEPEKIAAGLKADFARDVADPEFPVDALALFVEDEAGGDFRLARRFAFAGGS